MNQMSNYKFHLFFLAFSLAIQVFLAIGLIYLSNKSSHLLDTNVIDKFISEQKLKTTNESDQKLLKLANISREIDIQAGNLISQLNDVMKATSKLLFVSILAQIIYFISFVKTKKKDNIRFQDDALKNGRA
jgi:hypothetical protein